MGRVAKLAFAVETIALTANVVFSLTAATYAPDGSKAADAAEITQEGATDLVYRMDGTNPTTTQGHLWDVGTNIKPIRLVSLSQIQNFRGITSGAGVVVQVSYYR